MNQHADLSLDDCTLVVYVPLAIRQRGGRKQVVMPEGTPAWAPPGARTDSTLVKALARAFRWRKLLEHEVYASCEELAAAEQINSSYVSRVLRLTLLAPEIVEAILDGRHPPELTMAQLFRPFPVAWEEQWEVNAGAEVRFAPFLVVRLSEPFARKRTLVQGARDALRNPTRVAVFQSP